MLRATVPRALQASLRSARKHSATSRGGISAGIQTLPETTSMTNKRKTTKNAQMDLVLAMQEVALQLLGF